MRFSLSPEGIMQSARWEDTEKKKKQTAPIILTGESSLRSEFVDFSVPNIIERVDTFIRRINVDTTTFEEVFFRKTFIEKTTEQKAREAANFILRLEDQRLSLITGYHEVNYSAEVMQFMNEELRGLQEEYLALFKGKTVTTTSHLVLSISRNQAWRTRLLPFSNSPPTVALLKRNTRWERLCRFISKALPTSGKMASHQTQREKRTPQAYRIFLPHT
jgi:hypothetical protein